MATTCQFPQPDQKNNNIRMCNFPVAVPTEWNKRPQAVRTQDSINGFRQQLKTYLFRLAYPQPQSSTLWTLTLTWTFFLLGLSLLGHQCLRAYLHQFGA